MGGIINLKISPRRVSLAGASRYNPPIKYIDRIFREHVLIYCLSGEYEIYDNDIPFTLKKDDIMFQHAGIHHYGLKPCEPDTAILFVHFGCCEGDEYRAETLSLPPEGYACLPTCVSAARHPTVKRIFRQVCDDWINVVEERETEYHLKRLIEEISYIGGAEGAPSRKTGIVDKCLELIKQNPDKYFTTKDFSNLIFASESAIRNVFRANMNKSLYYVQRDYKLALVKSMLKEKPEIKLHEIAQSTGFCDEYQMSKTFKKVFGMTPKQYRQKLQAAEKAEE